MAEPLPDLIVLFTEWLAERLEISMDSKPFGLFAHAIEEAPGVAAETASVIRPYAGGGVSHVTPTATQLVQAYTRAPTAAEAMARGTVIDAALKDDDGLPMIGIELGNEDDGRVYVHAITNIRTPGQIGRDARNRVEVTQNFELSYTRV